MPVTIGLFLHSEGRVRSGGGLSSKHLGKARVRPGERSALPSSWHVARLPTEGRHLVASFQLHRRAPARWPATSAHWNLKIFEYGSCRKFKILQLSFQAQTHLKPSLGVKFKCLMIALFKFKFKFCFNFCVAAWNSLNMKVVQHSKPYNFSFRQKFIWAKIKKLFSKHVC